MSWLIPNTGGHISLVVVGYQWFLHPRENWYNVDKFENGRELWGEA